MWQAGVQSGHYLAWRGKPLLLIGDSVTQGWMECGTNFNQTDPSFPPPESQGGWRKLETPDDLRNLFVPSLDLIVTRQTGGSGPWQYAEYLRRASNSHFLLQDG